MLSANTPYHRSVVRLVGIYEMPAFLGLSVDCFAKSFDITLSGVGATRVALPRIEWGANGPIVVAPQVSNLPDQRGSGLHPSRADRDHWPNWGTITQWGQDPKRCDAGWVRSVAIELFVNNAEVQFSNYLSGLGHPEGDLVQRLFSGVEEWFQALLLWVGVAIDQDTEHRHPISGVHVSGQGLTLGAVTEAGERSLPSAGTSVTINAQESETLDFSVLKRIASHVSAGTVPHDGHLLLRDAFVEHRRSRFRKAVIDSASAVEIVLAPLEPPPVVSGTRKERRTPLLADLVKKYWGDPDAKVNLVDVRNDAIHKNCVPSRSASETALSIAKQIVDHYQPLPL